MTGKQRKKIDESALNVIVSDDFFLFFFLLPFLSSYLQRHSIPPIRMRRIRTGGQLRQVSHRPSDDKNEEWAENGPVSVIRSQLVNSRIRRSVEQWPVELLCGTDTGLSWSTPWMAAASSPVIDYSKILRDRSISINRTASEIIVTFKCMRQRAFQ